MSSGVTRMAVGSFIGTGSAISVTSLDFRPRYVKLLNVGGDAQGEWAKPMADASMQKVVDSGSGATDVSLVTSGGITPLANGFSLGTDSDLNASGELVHYIAIE
jgi:hypothetical protein